ncbi:MAG: PhoH family protein [Erysipelotrichaceae bacterium]|nr:PhoH family protein [Erysipelotrichaceae bacterium]MBR2544662.1 PhoH family protein [Erysipelotrichaceae bacterium]MBR2701842.1 PhoH family protein [Erysipelotrichaceae bacterium]
MAICGESDCNLDLIGNNLGCKVFLEGDYILTSDEHTVERIRKIIKDMVSVFQNKGELEYQDVTNLVVNEADSSFYREAVITGYGSRKFYLRTRGQKKLYDAFRTHDITLVTGPAGTGKTFLAVIYAVDLLRKGKVRKIIVTRPVVEAGESLGFLPGDLKEKVDPYLRPIYDSFDTLFGTGSVERLMEKGVIEIAPLAYMRGRTLNDAVVILDEAQNTTAMQIKMFLTRLGFNSKMIITGDVTQIDLPNSKQSGLKKAIEIVKDIEEIAVVEMHKNDVVRHPVVQKIIEAYEKKE